MKYSIAVLVDNRPGVLTHIAGLISRRGFNIETIAASSTEEAEMTRISILVEAASDQELEQLIQQLNKLVDVWYVLNMSKEERISRELGLLKVKAEEAHRDHITNLVSIFRARIVDVHPETMVIEVSGDSAKIDAFCEMMKNYGIIEIIRTGSIFLSRSPERAADNAPKVIQQIG